MSQQDPIGGPEKPSYPPAFTAPDSNPGQHPQQPGAGYQGAQQPGQGAYPANPGYAQQGQYPQTPYAQNQQQGAYPHNQAAQHPGFYQPHPAGPQQPRTRSHGGALAAIGIGVLVVGGFAGFGIRGLVPAQHPMDNAGAAQQAPARPGSPGDQSPFGNLFPDAPGGQGDGGQGTAPGGGQEQLPGRGNGGNQFPGGGQGEQGSGASNTTDATEAQEVGLVDINTDLKYQNGEAAGTGMILTSNGEILTNNHVIEGATSISVTVVSTQKQYTARVVGDDVTNDVAVLQLTNASGLTPVKMSSAAQKVGDAVTGVGNAGGDGGSSTAAPGHIISLNETITTEAEGSAQSESLDGLIQVDASIQPGDSGGPLYNSKNQVIGIDTAASTGTGQTSGYAIPISDALKIAEQIRSGNESETVSIGYPAFLGIELSAGEGSSGTAPGDGSGQGGAPGDGSGQGSDPFGGQQAPGGGQPGDGAEGAAFGAPAEGTDGGGQSVAGAQVAGVIPGTPADQAGIAAGDTITGVAGKTVSSADDLTGIMSDQKPGDSVKVAWTDASGASHSKTLKLVEGPAA